MRSLRMRKVGQVRDFPGVVGRARLPSSSGPTVPDWTMFFTRPARLVWICMEWYGFGMEGADLPRLARSAQLV